MICSDQKKISKALNIQYIPIQDLKGSEFLNKIEISICSRGFVQRLIQLKPPNLKFIQLTSVGFESLDLKLLKERNVMIANAKEVYGKGMAEFVVYSFLQSAKRYNKSIKNKTIRYIRNYKYLSELAGKTVTILGVGEIGFEIAKRLSAFDMKVLGFANNKRELMYFTEIFNSEDELKDCLMKSNYVISTLPYTQATNGFLNYNLFSSMKKNGVFMNVGRRETIDENDLFQFLEENRGFTAILDMFEKFPNSLTNRFRRLNNVLVLPGVTAISQEIDLKKIELARRNIELVLNNQIPKFIL